MISHLEHQKIYNYREEARETAPLPPYPSSVAGSDPSPCPTSVRALPLLPGLLYCGRLARPRSPKTRAKTFAKEGGPLPKTKLATTLSPINHSCQKGWLQHTSVGLGWPAAFSCAILTLGCRKLPVPTSSLPCPLLGTCREAFKHGSSLAPRWYCLAAAHHVARRLLTIPFALSLFTSRVTQTHRRVEK